MAMKIGTQKFKERVSDGLDNEFMRGLFQARRSA